MGQLAGIELQGSGAAFWTGQAGAATAAFDVDGWTVAVAEGSKWLVVYAPVESDIDQIFGVALARANSCLDYLSATGRGDAVIREACDSHLTWASTGSDVKMRVTSIIPGTLGMKMTVHVLDADGNAIPSLPPPPPQLHDALRFLRMARTGEVLYDAYRNLFLALEALLHHLRPQRRREREGDWFKAALRHVQPIASATLLAPDETDPIQWAYTNIYQRMRSNLMHAKRDYHLPGDEAARAKMERSFESLWRYTRELMGSALGASFDGESFAAATWKSAVRTVCEASELVATNNTNELPPRGGVFASPESDVVQLDSGSVFYPEDEDYLGVVDGSCTGQRVHALGPITRAGARNADGDAITSLVFEPALLVGDSVNEFQIRVGWRFTNPVGIRSHFPM
ncbi:hypothetical protein MMASJCM_2922 [Mycobacteroides abscessus subsp. massiliense CCUG 48898 = JCM 15300]|nr:hypothetical protein MMASJCM_2922 [Mycobacteroides abscessus subsp. massiliense CCUG 48898 = JCM 15300]